jgi:photosystem II stability/assembly factor-like uncharacterized protein
MDRLEDDLRRVLTDPRRSLPGDLVRIDAVHRGATRRRRNRGVAAAALAVVVVTGGVTLASSQLGGRDASLPAHSVAPTVSDTPSQLTTPTPTPTSTGSVTAPTALPVGLAPVSFTAIGTHTWWVLGTASCGTPPCAASLARTADGGRTFTAVTSPPAQWTPAGQGTTTDTVSDVRFASSADGWAFGGGLWSTHDGARSWRRVPMSGEVVGLGAGAGRVWALVLHPTGAEELWSTPRGSDTWVKTRLPLTLESADLAVEGSRVYVATRGNAPSLISSTDGGRTFTTTRTQCTSDLVGRVSASGGGVWLVCQTGMSEGIYPDPITRPDRVLDTSKVVRGALPNSALVAPRDASSALLAVEGKGLIVIRSDGGILHSSGLSGFASFVGFSTPSTGYAIVIVGSGTRSELLRTDDGGATWRKISLP